MLIYPPPQKKIFKKKKNIIIFLFESGIFIIGKISSHKREQDVKKIKDVTISLYNPGIFKQNLPHENYFEIKKKWIEI